jgi:hypothetical protein
MPEIRRMAAAANPRTDAMKKAARMRGNPQVSPITAANFTSPKPSPPVPSLMQKNSAPPKKAAPRNRKSDSGANNIRTQKIRRKQGRLSISGIRREQMSIPDIGKAKMRKIKNPGQKQGSSILNEIIFF